MLCHTNCLSDTGEAAKYFSTSRTLPDSFVFVVMRNGLSQNSGQFEFVGNFVIFNQIFFSKIEYLKSVHMKAFQVDFPIE